MRIARLVLLFLLLSGCGDRTLPSAPDIEKAVEARIRRTLKQSFPPVIAMVNVKVLQLSTMEHVAGTGYVRAIAELQILIGQTQEAVRARVTLAADGADWRILRYEILS